MGSKKPHVEIIARGVYVQEGHLLVCHSMGAANVYLPGGHVDFMEAAAKSLAREIQEEMGLIATVGRFLGCIEHTFMQKGDRHCEINLVFACDVPGLSPTQRPASCEAPIDFQWVSLSELAHANLEPSPLKRLLPVWLADDVESGWGSTYP